MAIEITAQSQAQVVQSGADLPVRLEVVATLLAGLNREQRRAVTHGDGPQLVLAGPGTGKTEVVTRRVAWLIATRRARPREILALTFTDAAAREMQVRVDVLVPYGQADAAIHTFHAFGDQVVREHAFELGLAGDVRLINRADAVVLLRDNLFDLGLSRYRPLGNPTRFLGALVDLFGRAKDECVGPQQLAEYARQRLAAATDEADLDAARALAEQAGAFERYQALLARNGLIDHGDQLALALRLLRERPSVGQAIRRRFRYLLVDEFQDVNRAQVELVLGLTPDRRNLTVVGDPDQAIYTFRGAGADNMSRLAATHPDLRRVVLRRNYRSRRPIVDAARRLIGHGPRWYVPHPTEESVAVRRGVRKAAVQMMVFPSPEDEADGVARHIAQRLASGQRPRDFAVLTRTNSELGSIVRSLALHGIAARSHSPADFFAHPEIRPLVALLRWAADPTRTLELYVLATAWPYSLDGPPLTELLGQARRGHQSLWDVMCRTIDGATETGDSEFTRRTQRLVADMRATLGAAHHLPAGELLYEHLRRSGRLGRLAADGQADAATAVARFFDLVRRRSALIADPRVASLVPHLDELIEAEENGTDDGPVELDAVSVMTAHRAKGLEFRSVYLTGLVDGRFPMRNRPAALALSWSDVRADNSADTAVEPVDDERRLFYVAMTRARDELWLTSHSATSGGRAMRRPSPFIAEALDLPVAIVQPAADPIVRIVGPGPAVSHALAAAVSEPPTHAQRTLSFSQIEEYLECPERYRLRHVLGLPTPAHHALSYGRALHSAVATFHLAADRGASLSAEDLAAAFSVAWTPEGFLSLEHEEARYAAGLRALDLFRTQQLADPAPVVAVERPFEFELAGVRIRGRMDRVDSTADGAVIVDYKSSDVRDQRTANQKARDSLQLQVYALAWQARTGQLPSAVRLHYLENGVVGSAVPEPKRLERATLRIAEALAGIAAASFPAKPSPIGCGFCPFRQVCPASAA